MENDTMQQNNRLFSWIRPFLQRKNKQHLNISDADPTMQKLFI